MNRIHYHVTLPRETYRIVKNLVRNWPQLVLERDAIINATPKAPDVPGRSGKISDPTALTVMRLEGVTRKLDAINAAIKMIDGYYMRGIWNNCLLRTPYPDYANKNTWAEYKRDFYFLIAVELNLPLQEDRDGTGAEEAASV